MHWYILKLEKVAMVGREYFCNYMYPTILGSLNTYYVIFEHFSLVSLDLFTYDQLWVVLDAF